MIIETGTTAGVSAIIEAWNWTTSEFDQIGSIDAPTGGSTGDEVFTFNLGPQAANFVQPSTQLLRSRVGWRQTGFTLTFPWTIQLDQVIWEAR